MWGSAAHKFFVVVAYDIVKNKTRTRVMKYLKGMGAHVQKSVFECLLTRAQIDEVKRRLTMEIDLEKDMVRIYILQRKSDARVELLGLGEQVEDVQLTIV